MVDAIFPKPTNTTHSHMMSIPATTSGSRGLLPGYEIRDHEELEF